MSVDVSALKERAKQQASVGGTAATKDAPPVQKTDPSQVARFVEDFERLNAPGADEPEDPATAALAAALAPKEPDDQIRYRGTPTDNPSVRRSIEERCEEMDFGDLVLSGRVSQRVPILPGKLEPVFQSLLGKETYWLERNAHIYGGGHNLAVASWLGYARLAMSMPSLNDQDFGGHLSPKDGTVMDDEVLRKVSRLLDMPEPLLELLLINFSWFGARVENLYRHDFKLLKNG